MLVWPQGLGKTTSQIGGRIAAGYPIPDREELRPPLEEPNAKRVAIPWLEGSIIQFGLADHEPIHPLKVPENRNRILGHR